jgi:hypothetical protein
MRRYLIICAVGLAGCGPDPATVPPDLLTPCPGWQGNAPATEGELIRAAAAEKAGRTCANTKLQAVAAVVGGG